MSTVELPRRSGNLDWSLVPCRSVVGSGSLVGTVRHERMRVPLHLLVFYVIVGLSFVHSPRSLGIARDLSLVGPLTSDVLECWALVLTLSYAAFAVATRKTPVRSVLVGGAVGAIVLTFLGTYYPNWLAERCSRKIDISSFVGADPLCSCPPDEIRRFEQTFGTPTSQLASGRDLWLIVRRDAGSRFHGKVCFSGAENSTKRRTRQRSQPEPAGWLGDKPNVIPGWLRWLTFLVMRESKPNSVGSCASGT